MSTYLITGDRGVIAMQNGATVKRDNRVVVTWSLAAGIVSMLDILSEWTDMQARQSLIVQRTLETRESDLIGCDNG